MSDDQQRRAGDEDRNLRRWTGWAGVFMSLAAFAAGLMWHENLLLIGGFLGAMWSGNRLPFDDVKKLIPWSRD